MMLLDVNILVEAHREDAPRHREVRAWLESQLAKAPGVAVTDLVFSGFVRVVTHPRVFKTPTPLEVALEFVECLRSRRMVTVMRPGSGHWATFANLCRVADARGNLVPDAFHAATAMEYGMEWVTLDRGFARYPGLRWSCPV